MKRSITLSALVLVGVSACTAATIGEVRARSRTAEKRSSGRAAIDDIKVYTREK